MTTSPLLEAHALGRRFGGREVVSGLSLALAEGQSLALIGPNGAGKSTTLGMLTTALRPDTGRITIGGLDALKDTRRVRAMLGVLFQYPALDDGMTPRNTLRLHAALYALPRRDVPALIADALDNAGLTEAADRAIRGFSGGMKRRLELARALMHRPRLLVLDEPTLGLDPQGRLDLWARIAALRSSGMAVLMTTHVLTEAESFDRVGIIDKGRLVALDSPEGLKRRYTGSPDTSLDGVFFNLTGKALRDSAQPLRPALIRRRA
ncbi:ABC transporter ATP-binding protein [Maliponia aquimaris]|uniref:Putative ABC transporter ATP-binding protein YxlF n=1 Tax=Maliponia aquimaris TaxID=1673631 RepID=A0A238JRC0_9RHOB|nr:ABC transporter ATP-binding protein [Maliponia aquimaris]SMX33095.1 putative ABC transporter ATP-binding protein YxlF [Maliponia aquimaris]